MNFNTTEEMNFAQELKFDLSVNESFERYKINCSNDLYNYIKPNYGNTIPIFETVFAVFLNQSSHILGVIKLSQGGITSSVVDLRLLFSAALGCLATNIILVHNHPTGNLTPSIQDREITKQAQEVGKLLSIRITDHIIITENSYYSFADEGILN